MDPKSNISLRHPRRFLLLTPHPFHAVLALILCQPAVVKAARMSAAAATDSLSQPHGVAREVLLQAAKALLLSLVPHHGSKQCNTFESYAAMAAAVPKGSWFGDGDANGDHGHAKAAVGGAAAAGEYSQRMRCCNVLSHQHVCSTVVSVNRAAAAMESRAGMYAVIGDRCAVAGA